MYQYRRDDWSQLVGFFVEVRHDQQILRSGFVDRAMPDSSALWLAADGIEKRTLIAKVEGYEVWIDARCLSRLKDRLST
ncbi:hypothetical protein M1E17_09505 [Arthrobacter sp. D1-29]